MLKVIFAHNFFNLYLESQTFYKEGYRKFERFNTHRNYSYDNAQSKSHIANDMDSKFLYHDDQFNGAGSGGMKWVKMYKNYKNMLYQNLSSIVNLDDPKACNNFNRKKNVMKNHVFNNSANLLSATSPTRGNQFPSNINKFQKIRNFRKLKVNLKNQFSDINKKMEQIKTYAMSTDILTYENKFETSPNTNQILRGIKNYQKVKETLGQIPKSEIAKSLNENLVEKTKPVKQNHKKMLEQFSFVYKFPGKERSYKYNEALENFKNVQDDIKMQNFQKTYLDSLKNVPVDCSQTNNTCEDKPHKFRRMRFDAMDKSQFDSLVNPDLQKKHQNYTAAKQLRRKWAQNGKFEDADGIYIDDRTNRTSKYSPSAKMRMTTTARVESNPFKQVHINNDPLMGQRKRLLEQLRVDSLERNTTSAGERNIFDSCGSPTLTKIREKKLKKQENIINDSKLTNYQGTGKYAKNLKEKPVTKIENTKTLKKNHENDLTRNKEIDYTEVDVKIKSKFDKQIETKNVAQTKISDPYKKFENNNMKDLDWMFKQKQSNHRISEKITQNLSSIN